MNTTTENNDSSRPFGYWLKAVDRLMAAEFAAAFESFGVTRREWRMLNRIDGTVADDAHPLPVHKLHRLIELGWVTDADGPWTLTDEGREAKERLGAIVDGIRAKVADAVPAEDLATTMATLEQLARAFGWDESTPLPRRAHGPRGFGRGHGRHGHRPHGFGPRGFGHDGHHFDEHGYGERGECRHEHASAHAGERGHHGDPRDHGHPHGHPRARFARFAQGAYERGFEAGFTRGRDDR